MNNGVTPKLSGSELNSSETNHSQISDSPMTLCVAPMLDWTDRHCRAFHRILAPNAYLYSEMVHANAIVLGQTERFLAHDPSEHPVALQLGGSEPQLLANAARIVEEYGFDEVNLNVGCPSDRVQAGRFGACLMLEPTLVADCVAAMQAVVNIPVTVKCRLGIDKQESYSIFENFISTVAEAGCSTFIVHARNAWLNGLSPKENREVPPLRYEWAYQLKQRFPHLTIILNGGINTLDAIKTHLNQVDGVMIGRQAYHDPYRLHEYNHALWGTPLLSREALLEAYFPYIQAQLQKNIPLKQMTRHLLGIFLSEKGGRKFRQILSEESHLPSAGLDVLRKAIQSTK